MIENDKVTSEIGTPQLLPFIKYAINQVDKFSKMPAAAFQLPGLKINVHSRNKKYVDYCARGYAHLGKQIDAIEEINLYLCSPDDDAIAPPPKWGDDLYFPFEIEKLLADTPYSVSYFHDSDLWHIWDKERKIGLQWMRSRDGFPPWEKSAPFRMFLHWAYSNLTDHKLVHSGTLGINGNGILLSGNGGAGKSGTVFSGIMNNLQTVGDDYVLVENNAGTVTARPLFEILKQDVDGINRLGLNDHLKNGKSKNWQGKYEFVVDEISNQPLARQLNIRAIVIPKVGDNKFTSIHPIGKAQAMIALAPSSLFQFAGERVSGAKYFAELVRTLPCFEMKLGKSSKEISGKIKTFLEEFND